ncbi:MAG: GMC family oxidoreductase [Byssovorax sp.]
MADAYDYVVVGGGSAGCIAAAELAADPDMRVLLLERGEPGEANPETLTADGYKYAFANDRVILERFTVPQQGCGGRRLFAGTGMGMGGSGAVNGMVYTRGSALDYAEWPEGWHFDDLVPDFEAIEQKLRPRPRPPTRFTDACIAAAEEAGFAHKEDLDDGTLKGFLGHERMTYEGDARRSSFVAYLREPGVPPNLTIVTGALAEQIVFDGDKRAVGLRYRKDGRSIKAEVKREVVLAAGALESPKLLLLSGVGPADHLRSMGIEVVLDQPAIGENLHDHPNVVCFFLGEGETDCHYPQLYGFHRANPALPLPPEQADSCYVFYTARSSLHLAALRMVPALLLPRFLYDRGWVKRGLRRLLDAVLSTRFVSRMILRIYGVVVILGKPMSRGTLRLSSRDPSIEAAIDPAYFRDARDMDTIVNGVRLARTIANGKSLTAWGNRPLDPGRGAQSDAAIAKWARKNAMTTYHFAGTCRMGADAEAPVDTRLRLRGVTGVRIADASAVPSVPVSAMNAPSMLVGHRAARYLREDARAAAKPEAQRTPAPQEIA